MKMLGLLLYITLVVVTGCSNGPDQTSQINSGFPAPSIENESILQYDLESTENNFLAELDTILLKLMQSKIAPSPSTELTQDQLTDFIAVESTESRLEGDFVEDLKSYIKQRSGLYESILSRANKSNGQSAARVEKEDDLKGIRPPCSKNTINRNIETSFASLGRTIELAGLMFFFSDQIEAPLAKSYTLGKGSSIKFYRNSEVSVSTVGNISLLPSKKTNSTLNGCDLFMRWNRVLNKDFTGYFSAKISLRCDGDSKENDTVVGGTITVSDIFHENLQKSETQISFGPGEIAYKQFKLQDTTGLYQRFTSIEQKRSPEKETETNPTISKKFKFFDSIFPGKSFAISDKGKLIELANETACTIVSAD